MLSDLIFYLSPQTKDIQKAVIMLHGYGSNGNDLISMAPYMAKSLPNTIFYAPNAPLNVLNGYKWFDLEDYVGAGIYEHFDYLKTLMERTKPLLPTIFDFIQHIAEKHKLDSKQIILMGFSQGGFLALTSGLLYENELSGIIGASSIPVTINEPLTVDEIKNKPRVLLTHGTADDVVPYVGLQISQNTLKNIGCNVQTHCVMGMGHEIDNSSLNEMIEFIQKS